MNNWIFVILVTFIMAGLSSCSSNDEELYPNIITNFADLSSDENSVISKLILDDGTTYTLSNPQKGDSANCTYRTVAGYVTTGEYAQLYSTKTVYILRDSTSSIKNDATGIECAWREGKYINLQLTPKTQGGKQFWGYSIDSVASTTPRHFYLTLHHNQNSDPISYSTTVYASILLKFIQGYSAGDTISLTVNTFKGKKEFILH